MKIDHALGLGSEVSNGRGGTGSKILTEKLGQGESTDAHADPLEELTPRKSSQVMIDRIHEKMNKPSPWLWFHPG